jgi:hypothetical protein
MHLVEGHTGVLCSDSDNPDDHRCWVRAGARAEERFGYFGRMWTWFSSMCATWEGSDADRYTRLVDGMTPPHGTSCRADTGPFDTLIDEP